MATVEITIPVYNFEITKARTEVVLVTIEGITDWTDLLVKLQANFTMDDDTPSIELEGRIYSDTNQASFAFAVSDTEDLAVKFMHYEIVVYTADKSFVRNSTTGTIRIKDPVSKDPTD